jgi:hypothetical protein
MYMSGPAPRVPDQQKLSSMSDAEQRYGTYADVGAKVVINRSRMDVAS